MAEYPALPLFTDAFLGDTLHLTSAQLGAYMLLLMAAWRSPDCSLLNDDGYLARICRMEKRTWATNKAVILAFWHINEAGKLYQKRLADERNFVEHKRNINSANGKASALKRLNRGSTTVQPNANEIPTPTPTPTISPLTKEVKGESAHAKKTKLKGTRLPADWKLPVEWGEWAEKEYGMKREEIVEQARIFRDYWHSTTKNPVKLDWFATWRNWIRRKANGGI